MKGIDMATYARKLKDSSGNYIAPATRASCVYMNEFLMFQYHTQGTCRVRQPKAHEHVRHQTDDGLQ